MMNTPFPEGSDLKIQFSTILLSVFFTAFFTGAFFLGGFSFFVISVWLDSATMVKSQKGGKRKFGTMNVGNNRLFKWCWFYLKGCDSNFKVIIFPILKVATNETTTLH